MSEKFEIRISQKVEKWLLKTAKINPKLTKKITTFIEETLAEAQIPSALPNAKKLQAYKDNRYRWRLGEYRIIGTIQNGKLKIINIIQISKRDSKTYQKSDK